ncbi:MAG: UDP-N-acetylmuramoyl-L-alanine--D-glutamate ligase [Kordiimonadaceae bacterium]|jgi:UDP-N-acetylmuramoyl-L-alanine---L-glutamate ligase|nr:UDP-N-acetylmuramoyl-L-alanine--D-glutamate ligase [Kordiimonadaceae bacterium]
MHLSELENKRIAIWGMGREGKTTLAFLKGHFPDKIFTIINNEAIDGKEYFISEIDLLCHLDAIDVVIKSPGISYYHQAVELMIDAGIVVTSATNIWFDLPKTGMVIAITGSNGKSTTSALLYHIMTKLGLKVELGGNIGTPLLSLPLDADYYVVELSSYQTCDLKSAPDIAVLLNLYPEHIQWHKTHDAYFHDKCNLLRRGAPINIVNAGEPRLADTENKVCFNARDKVHFESGIIYMGDMPVGGTDKFPLLGEHNLENLCAALTIAKELGLILTECLKASYDYPGLAHRLQVFGPIGEITYINDSISTDPEATIAALEALKDQNVTLIVGGEDRAQDYQALGNVIEKTATKAICVYETGPRLFDQLNSAEKYKAATLEEAVKKAKDITPKGGTILLSPAAPSYDAFKDFEVRGDLFMALAKS